MPPPYYPDGALITIVPKLRMYGNGICDVYICGRSHTTWDHGIKYITGDRGEVVGSDVGEPPCPHPSYHLILSIIGTGTWGDIKKSEEGYLVFPPLNSTDPGSEPM